MTNLSYDPAAGAAFWDAIQRIPGYPVGEIIPLKQILVESGALFKLPALLTEYSDKTGRDVLVVMDATPMRRGDEDLKAMVMHVIRDAGWQPVPLVLQADSTGQVHTDLPHIEEVKAHLRPDTPVVSVGSGVVTDVAKHACFLYEQETGHHLLYLVNQTANSVSAYTSNMAPVLIDGVKRTLPSRYPEAVISDLETLRDAPREMTMAGVGDLLSAFVSFADWYLAKRLGMDPSFNELPQALMRGLDEILLASADDIRDLRLEGMAVLAKLIHLAGLAMSLSHATTPLSGYEHVMSHTIDMNNETQGLPLAPHGSQVALASILCSGAYQAFLEQFSPEKIALDNCYPPARQMRERILSTFAQLDPSGKAGDECWADYSLKLERWTDQRENLARFLQEWHPIQQELHQLARPPQVLFQILRAVGAPLRFEELFPPVSPDSARFAFLNSPLMRRRLTLGDLLIFFQWDREKLWNQLFDDFFNLVHL